MFAINENRLSYIADLSPAGKSVYALLDYFRGPGLSLPSNSKIAREGHMGKASVKKGLAELINVGILTP